MTLETIITELVVNGGDARSKALEAIAAAKDGDFALADENMQKCKDSLGKAHAFQTEMIQAEAAGDSKYEVSLLMVHGQDHLMNAMTVKDLAGQMIEMYQIIYDQREEGK